MPPTPSRRATYALAAVAIAAVLALLVILHGGPGSPSSTQRTDARQRSASIEVGAPPQRTTAEPSPAEAAPDDWDEADGIGLPADLVLPKPIVQLTTAEVEHALDRLAAASPLYWDLAPGARQLHDDLTEQLRIRLGVPPPAERLVAQPDRYLERARQIEEEMNHAR